MSIQTQINRIKSNVQNTLNTIADTGVTVGSNSDALPAAAVALANEKAPFPVVSNVTLKAASWTGENPYTQSVSLSGITAQSKVDLQPDTAVLESLINDGINALYIANDNGSLTAYALGAIPATDMTVQATITEVKA